MDICRENSLFYKHLTLFLSGGIFESVIMKRRSRQKKERKICRNPTVQIMKKNIKKQIEAGYGDLRKSEKQAADYILSHMEEAAELPLDRLAHCAGVSQPTVLRMLKALGFDGYKDFRYQLVAELARLQPGRDQADQLMYGYTLSRQAFLRFIRPILHRTGYLRRYFLQYLLLLSRYRRYLKHREEPVRLLPALR